MIAKISKIGLYIIFLTIFYIPSHNAYASIEDDGSFDYILETYNEGEYFNQDQGPGAKRKVKGGDKAPDMYIYETPTVKALSHLFWAVNMYNVEDDEAIDEFMRINECEMYRNFSSDELEWGKIRKATGDFLVENKGDFPTRFEFLLPLKLGDYNKEKGVMEIQEEYKIKNSRRFELVASDYREANVPCVKGHNIAVGYPRAIILEFSRPFNLTSFPVEKEKATKYIKSKLDLMKSKYDPRAHSKKLALKLRNAYLLIKVKIFTYGKILKSTTIEGRSVQMIGVLEGYEIYEDQGRENLFYAQNYVTSRKRGKLNNRLKPQYEILRKRAAENGVLHP